LFIASEQRTVITFAHLSKTRFFPHTSEYPHLVSTHTSEYPHLVSTHTSAYPHLVHQRLLDRYIMQPSLASHVLCNCPPLLGISQERHKALIVSLEDSGSVFEEDW